MEKTFKEIEKGKSIEKQLKKVGLSYGIVFSKEDIEKFNLEYGDTIRLDNAEIIKNK